MPRDIDDNVYPPPASSSIRIVLHMHHAREEKGIKLMTFFFESVSRLSYFHTDGCQAKNIMEGTELGFVFYHHIPLSLTDALGNRYFNAPPRLEHSFFPPWYRQG